MSLGTCLTDLVSRKLISSERADALRPVYDELVAQYEPKFGRAAAEAMATDKAMKSIGDDFAHRKRQQLLQLKAQASILDNAKRIYGGGLGDGPITRQAMRAHLVHDTRANGIANVEYRWKNIKQSAFAMMHGILSKHRANLIGEIRNKSDLGDMVRELYGEATGSVNARELADGWKRTAEFLRQQYNAAGGRIAKLEGWALPHRHDGERVGAVSAEAWIDDILPRLDRDRMIDRQTGEPMSEMKLRAVLRGAYEGIVSDGWDSRAPGAMGAGSIANRNTEHRVLHFKSADEWMAYNDRYGTGSPYEAMILHVETMSRDIASMQILGPNPEATIRWMKDVVTQDAANKGKLPDRGQARIGDYEIDAIWNEVKGQNSRAVRRNLALFGSSIRNWQTSTKLGSATLTAVSDQGTAALTRAYNGIPAVQDMGRYLKQLNPADPATREFARRRGVISDELIGRMAGQGRMHIEDSFGGRLSGGPGKLASGMERANELTRRLADGVMRASGLNAHTVAMREAVAMEFWATAADNAKVAFGDLEPSWRGFLERYGIGREGWDKLRATPMTDHRGADFITPDRIEDAALRDRFMEAVLQETDYAVPTAGLYTRAIVHVAPPGTVIGEIMRTGFQFKSFPIAVMASHGVRAMAQGTLGKKAGYAAAFVGGTTMMGALSFQLAEIAKGKDPAPMQGGEFWWKSLLKGGGLGIYGDLIENSRNEFGQSAGDITAGPSWGSVDNVSLAIQAAASTLSADNDEDIEKAAKLRHRATRNLLMREVPGSSLWYTRAAYERLLVDQVAAWAGDPGDSYQRMERRAAESGQGFFIPPGAAVDQWRAPAMASAVAAPPE